MRLHVLACALVLLSLGITTAAAAERPTPTAGHRRFPRAVKIWGPSPVVFDLDQGPDGFLWMGTRDGLFRYDGVDFRRYFTDSVPALPDTPVYQVHAARDGTVWLALGTGVRLHGYRRDEDPERPHGPPALARLIDERVVRYDQASGLPSANVSAFAETLDGTLWIATDKGIARFRGGRFEVPAAVASLATTKIRALATDEADTLYIGIEDAVCLIQTRDPDPGLACAPTNGVPALGFVMLKPSALVVTPAGLSEIVAPEGAAPGRQPALRPWKDSASWARTARAATTDRDGVVWVATANGLASAGQNLGLKAGLPDDQVLDVLADREGSLWVGMRTGGLAHIHDPIIVNLGKTEGLAADHAIALLEARDGTMWVTTPAGVSHFVPPRQDNDVRGPWRFEDLSALNRIFAGPGGAPNTIAQSADGVIWVGTAGRGLVRIAGGIPTRIGVAEGLPQPDIRALAVDRNQALWIGWASGGASRFPIDGPDAGNFRSPRARHLTADNGMCPAPVIAIVERPDGEILLATDGAGFGRFRNDAVRCVTTADGLPSNTVTGLADDRTGTLWAATRFDSGIVRLSGPARPIAFNQGAGLPCDTIHHVTADARDNLWIACGSGVARLSPGALSSMPRISTVIEPSHLFFDHYDGMRTDQISYTHGPGVLWSRAGELWVATSLGVSVIRDPDITPPVAGSARAVIERASVNGNPVSVRHDARVVAREGHLDVAITAAAFLAPQRTTYRYRLHGLETNWREIDGHRPDSDSRAGRPIEYHGLHPGHYEFQVAACDAFRRWGPTASFALVVALPFHQSGVFLALLAVAALILIYGGHRLRLRQVRSRFRLIEQERGRIARDLHDGLAQGFAAVGMHLAALDDTLAGGQDDARAILGRVRDLLEYCSKTAKGAVWNLRRDAAAATLRSALDRIVREGRDGAGADVAINLHVRGKAEPGGPKSAMFLHEIPFIAQEALTNALVHGHPRVVDIVLESSDTEITLTIRDDGLGIAGSVDDLAARGHFGILGMRERARRLDGQLTIESPVSAPRGRAQGETGGGTVVRLVAPLAHHSSHPDQSS